MLYYHIYSDINRKISGYFPINIGVNMIIEHFSLYYYI